MLTTTRFDSRRKTWIYSTILHITHRLSSVIHAHFSYSATDIEQKLCSQYTWHNFDITSRYTSVMGTKWKEMQHIMNLIPVTDWRFYVPSSQTRSFRRVFPANLLA